MLIKINYPHNVVILCGDKKESVLDSRIINFVVVNCY
jgi:hypothetical protein